MTDHQATYTTSTSKLQITSKHLLKYDEPGYVPPSYKEVKLLKDMSGMTGGQLANLAGVNQRTFRKWLAPPEAQNSAQIPYAAWRLLLIECGIIEGKTKGNKAQREIA